MFHLFGFMCHFSSYVYQFETLIVGKFYKARFFFEFDDRSPKELGAMKLF
jgi:hypothetical protein